MFDKNKLDLAIFIDFEKHLHEVSNKKQFGKFNNKQKIWNIKCGVLESSTAALHCC